MINTENPRDTQFSRFAKLLWEEIGKMQDAFCEECGTGPHSLVRDMGRAETFDQSVQRLIACRLYDFAKHAFYELDIWRSGSLDRAVQCIPDLKKWPDEAEYPGAGQ